MASISDKFPKYKTCGLLLLINHRGIKLKLVVTAVETRNLIENSL